MSLVESHMHYWDGRLATDEFKICKQEMEYLDKCTRKDCKTMTFDREL
jgi:hypothetical protein